MPNNEIDDELNIDLLFNTIHTKLLIKLVNEKPDLINLARKILSNRGVGKLGQNVRFSESEEIWGVGNFITDGQK